LRSAFGAKHISGITVADVDAFKVARPDVSKKTLANLLTLLISTLRLAVDLGWLRSLPKIRKPKIDVASQDYRYLETRADVDRLLRAAKGEGDDVFALYATAVFTGMRAGELAGLHWADVNFDSRLIVVRFSFTGPTKSGEALEGSRGRFA
jgi:integrase